MTISQEELKRMRNPQPKGDPTHYGYGGSKGFVKAVVSKGKGSQVLKTALNEGQGTQGGYVVPPEYSVLLYKSIAETSILWPRATVVPMTSLTLQLPKPDFKTAQAAGTTALFGGIKFVWGVGSSYVAPVVAETEPTSELLTLKANDLIGQLIASNQFVQDIQPTGEEFLIRLFGEAAAWYADYAFFNGTGISNSQPLGILNSPCLKTASRAVANKIGLSDVAEMGRCLLPSSWPSAIWVCSPTALEYVTQLTNYQSNQPYNPVMPGAYCGCLLSRPVFVSEKLPTLGTQGDLLLIDPKLYVIGDRQEVLIDASIHPLFKNNQTVFLVWLRCDGRPLLDSVVTLADGSTTASGFVALAA